MYNKTKLTCKECGFFEYVNLLRFPAVIPSGKDWMKLHEKDTTYYFCSENCKSRYNLRQEVDWMDNLESFLDYYYPVDDD